MRIRPRRAIILVLSIATTLSLPALAQDQPAPDAAAATMSSADRLFLSFVEDAAVPESQWWEGQVEFANGDPTDAILARAVVAFQVFEDVEFGGRVGFGSTDAPRGLDDGTGATDLDLWGKYRIAASADTQFAFGALVTVPTGDDQAGLGFDSFGLGLFGAVRHRLAQLSIAGNIGVRLTEDGKTQGFNLEGRTAPFVSGAVIAPLNDALSVIGELRVEGERYRGFDEDARVLGGINWRLNNRALVRAALALGLTDGAPDSQLLASFAYTF